MKSTVIVKIRGDGYIATVGTQNGNTAIQGMRIGKTPHEAATRCAELMLQYAAHNPDGGALMAPAEVFELVLAHLRDITGRSK
jgi:hypothetical protein